MPNEDAQSLIFDDSNLFKINKFSGWDRVEGGSRANVGVQYTAQFNRGGNVNVLFGQSYQLFGQNSFAIGGPTNTGLQTGLDTQVSDYVARASYQPNTIFTFTSRFRFDETRLHAAAHRTRDGGELRPLDHRADVWRLCGAAGARLPRRPEGHPGQFPPETGRELAAVWGRRATIFVPTSSTRPSSASDMSTTASSWP